MQPLLGLKVVGWSGQVSTQKYKGNNQRHMPAVPEYLQYKNTVEMMAAQTYTRLVIEWACLGVNYN